MPSLARATTALVLLPGLITSAAWGQGVLLSGQPVTGQMNAGTGPGIADCHVLRVDQPSTIDVSVRSTQFDPVVILGRGTNCKARVPVWRNDNEGTAGAGAKDARLVLENREAGMYFVEVGRADQSGGRYEVVATIRDTPAPRVLPTPMAPAPDTGYAPPPRPAGYAHLSDGDLRAHLDASIPSGPGMSAALAAMDPVAKAWLLYHARLISREARAGTNRWLNANPSTAELDRRRARAAAAAAEQARVAATASAAPQAVAAPAAPPLAAPRPGRCTPSGACYFAVVAHYADEFDANQRSYDGTKLGWGIQVSNTASSRFTVPIRICGIQVYAAASDEKAIRGRLAPTSQAYARRFSLSPHDGGFPICEWFPPRYTGPDR